MAETFPKADEILLRAQGLSVANPKVSVDTGDIIFHLNAAQQDIFTRLADENVYYYQALDTMTSTAGAERRVIDLTETTRPVERVIKATLADGRELNQVDLRDLSAEIKPRYYVSGPTMVEVDNDWDPDTASAVLVELAYAYRPTDLDPQGGLSQSVLVPRRFVDLLAIKLGLYLHLYDIARPAEEAARLESMYEARWDALLRHLAHFGGVETRAFIQATPRSSGKK